MIAAMRELVDGSLRPDFVVEIFLDEIERKKINLKDFDKDYIRFC